VLKCIKAIIAKATAKNKIAFVVSDNLKVFFMVSKI